MNFSSHLAIFSLLGTRGRELKNEAIITSNQRLNTHNKHQRKWRFDMDIWTKDLNTTYLFCNPSRERERESSFFFSCFFVTFWISSFSYFFCCGCSIELKHKNTKKPNQRHRVKINGNKVIFREKWTMWHIQTEIFHLIDILHWQLCYAIACTTTITVHNCNMQLKLTSTVLAINWAA